MSELDAALERFQASAPEFGPGLANHGPMACEALLRLGHEALIPGFVERYAPRLPPCPQGEPIPESEQRTARGRPARIGDWIVSWQLDLEAGPWRERLAEAVGELLPGCFASAGHGLLRTAHAVRALGDEDSPLRRRELAYGLGLWSARYQELPGTVGARPAGVVPAALLATGPVVAPARRRAGLFTEQVAVLDTEVAFDQALAAVDLGDAPLSVLSSLCAAAARAYLANPGARIAYVHALTIPSALRMLAPLLPSALQREAVGCAVKAAVALHAVSHCDGEESAASAEVERLAGDEAETRYRAACSLDDHAIKFSEACLREDRVAPDPALRLAAADAALHMGETPQRAC